MPYNIGIDARRLFEPRIGRYVQNLVRSLAGIDEDNIYSLFVGERYDGEFDDLPANFVRVVERSQVHSFRERLALSWSHLRQGLDLYHATHYVLPLWAPRRTVTTVHDIVHLLYPEFMPGRLAMFVAPAQIRGTLARSDRIIAESQNTKTDLVDYFDVRESKVTRIYPGVEASFDPEPRPGDEEARRRLGIEGPYVLFRGDERRHKNEERVLRAFAAARRSGNDGVGLVGFGDRELSVERFAHLTRALEIANRVRWLDAAEDLAPALLRGAKLFLYPTLYEGFPAPVVEAMACGVPVITSDNATIREIAEGSAKLIEPSSVESLAGALSWCLNDDQLAADLVADGLERARGFRWQRVAEQTLEVYESALGSGERSRFLPRRRRPA
ncbi:MAG: glycosyltransferase family 1 protein [Acidobacteria bacterium]|nr:glycosyltransferase family 1 protein [Acidobacteriota bacterium]